MSKVIRRGAGILPFARFNNTIYLFFGRENAEGKAQWDGVCKNIIDGNPICRLTVEDTLVLAGNALTEEPLSGGFGIEAGPIITQTVNGAVSSSTSVTLDSGTGVLVGQGVYGTGVASGATVSGISGTSLTLSTASSIADGAKSIAVTLNPDLEKLEKSIFNGEYPTDISSDYLEKLEVKRG